MSRRRSLTSETELGSVLEQYARAPLVIAIDGLAGIGKTSLARRVGTQLNFPVVECDLFIKKNCGNLHYPAILDLNQLGETIAINLAGKKPVLVEGVLLRLVLENLQLSQVLHVYVKHRSLHGALTQPELFDEAQTEIDLLAKITHMAAMVGIRDDEPVLARELLRYHKQRLPHKHADLVYEICF